MSDFTDNLIRIAQESRGDAAKWTDAWIATVQKRPELLSRGEPDMWGWMVGWFANALASCGHVKDESAAALAEFRARHPEIDWNDDKPARTRTEENT